LSTLGWIKNLGITSCKINSAHETIYLTSGKSIVSKKRFDLTRINGSAKRSDLLIYYPKIDKPNWRHGDVAVVVCVSLENGTVSLKS